MKKLLISFLILAITITAIVPVDVLYAQVSPPPPPPSECTINWELNFNLVSCLFSMVFDLVSTIILAPFAGLMGLSGLALDMVIKYTILEMSVRVDGGVLDGVTYTGLTGINIAWKLIRDLMNIVFIFMLVYEAIKLILSQSSTQNIGRFIGFLVLAALLVNFSLFFTKIMIDASNIITIGIYNSILSSASITIPGLPPIQGISVPFMANLGLTSIFGSNVVTLFGSYGNAIIATLLGSVFMLIAAFVFFAVSLVFVIRYVTLIILLMLSPVAFMGNAMPFMKKYSESWWESLKSQLLFPPLYMLMTWVVLTLMGSAGFLRTTDVWSASSTAQDKVSFLLNFVIIIILMIASLVIAKDTAKKGSGYIGDATKKLSGFAGGVVLGGVARTGRNTLGRLGNSWAESEDLKKQATEGNFRQRLTARTQLALGNRAAESTFDVRATERFGGLAKTTGFDFGKVDKKKENYRAIVKDVAETQKKKMEVYKPNEVAYAEAKEQDKISREKAKSDLEKNVHKKTAEEYFNSDEYKNSDVGKSDIEARKVVDDYDKAKKQTDEIAKKLKKKEEELENNKIIGADAGIKEEIFKLQNEQKTNNANLESLERVIEQKKKIVSERNEARTKYENEVKSKLQEAAKKESSPNENALNTAWQNRVDAVADKFGHMEPKARADARELLSKGVDSEGKLLTPEQINKLKEVVAKTPDNDSGLNQAWRDVTKGFGSVTHALGLTSMPLTRANRQQVRRAMMSAPKGKKTVEDTLKDLLKDQGEVSPGTENNAGGENKDAATPATPAATPETPTT